MKKTTIVLIILIASIVGTFIATFTATTTSVTFEEAFAEPGTEFKISGTLDTDFEIKYDPETNHNLTVFHMRDKNNQLQEIKLKKPLPQGLDRSESIDLYGSVINGEFYASDILMKCPSKYNEDNHLIDTAQAN